MVAGETSKASRLIVVYGHRSLDAMQLREAARGWCELIWLIDSADPSAAAMAPLLARSGPVVDALGLPATDAAAALRPHHPDGVASFYDANMEHIAMIAAELGLRFNSRETALALEDKLHQREALRAGGVASPPVVAVPAGADPRRIVESVDAGVFPAVLKPRRASGSWHTFKVDGAEELTRRLVQLAGEPTEDLIVEGYLPDGPAMPNGWEAGYVSVETIAADGQLVHLGTTGRLPLVAPMRETGFFMPSTLDQSATAAVLREAESALRAVDFRFGCAHTELKLTGEGPRVLEINGRVGGGVPEMLRLTTGLDIIALTMRAALGLALEVPAMPEPDGVSYRFFYQPPASARKLIAIEGLDEIGRAPGVESIFLHHKPGTELDSAHGTRTYLFALVGHARDHAGVRSAYELMNRTIEATYTHGSDVEQAGGPTPAVAGVPAAQS